MMRIRSLTGMVARNQSVPVWANCPNVSVAINIRTITVVFLEKNLILPAKIVHAKGLCLCPPGLRSVECTGWSDAKILMWPVGGRLASIFLFR